MAEFIYAGDAGVFKSCPKCGDCMALSYFSLNKMGLLGRASICKECVNRATRLRYDNNSKEINQKRKVKRDENITAEQEYRAELARKKRRARGAVEIGEVIACASCKAECVRRGAAQIFCGECANVKRREAVRQWNIDNRDRVNERKRALRAEDPARHSEYRKKWASRNRDKINAIERKRLREDPKFRLDKNLSRAIRAALSSGKNGSSWKDLLDYTLDDLVIHLENQFLPGMTWGNYGEWHIDHKIPKSVFNYSSPEHIDFKRCWALDNLMPLWGIDNKIKSNKLERPFQPSLELAIGDLQ